ncbi:hypothetical protein NPA08_03300 [Mycoplasmopsis citelli]|uniref:Uncharacterized protein n=1 Tax=Mycoplasmopsis citelli TaxID=171281 RepID=A0A449B1L2_9BACT|nr:hypothetical protein [Mycoplasmopsis citelli]UUD35958.1 hypothetical protein NPA08_03300 [Mycoplasmopsis citelli]VEU74499.1 Uncharacterised protein [Mycoplasmopsis citelli]
MKRRNLKIEKKFNFDKLQDQLNYYQKEFNLNIENFITQVTNYMKLLSTEEQENYFEDLKSIITLLTPLPIKVSLALEILSLDPYEGTLIQICENLGIDYKSMPYYYEDEEEDLELSEEEIQKGQEVLEKIFGTKEEIEQAKKEAKINKHFKKIYEWESKNLSYSDAFTLRILQAMLDERKNKK